MLDEEKIKSIREAADKMMDKMKERKSYTLSYQRIVRAIVLV